MKIYPYITAEEAVQIVKSGDRVFSHGSASTPVFLLNKLLARAGEINDIELVSISTFGDIEWEKPGVTDSFYLNSLFVSANVRKWANSASGRYVPIFLSEIPILFSKGYLPLDVAIVQVSPPDQHGYCSLGTSVDAAWSAVRNAKKSLHRSIQKCRERWEIRPFITAISKPWFGTKQNCRLWTMGARPQTSPIR